MRKNQRSRVKCNKKWIASKMLSIALAVVLCLTWTPITDSKAQIIDVQSVDTQATQTSTQQFANLVLIVSFSDTETTYWDGTASELDQYYNTTGRYTALSAKDYYTVASCGLFELQNCMPQIVEVNDVQTVMPIILDNTVSYYQGQSSDYQLLTDTVSKLNEDATMLSGLTDTLDYDGDGYIDNVTVLVACSDSDRNSVLYPHKSNCASWGLSIQGKSLDAYNVINYGRLSGVSGGAGVVSHELMHVLGPLDTYTVCDGTSDCGEGPVGCWDIMAQTSIATQYPLAYTRKELGWIRIEEATVSGTYTLTSPQSNSDGYALILTTPYSDREVFVVEYRKKGSMYNEENVDKIDHNIGGSGVIVYRVNLDASPKSNLTQDYIYVFRSGESENTATIAGAMNAYLSSEAGRTTYGSSEVSAATIDGAITYTDGTNSGIVISNVGSAGGDSISLKIDYTIDMTGKSWETEAYQSAMTGYDSGLGLDVAMLNGTLYGSNVKTCTYNGKLYGVYSNSGAKAELLCYENGTWKSVKVLNQNYCYDVDLTVGSDGLLYIVCGKSDYSGFSLYSINAAGTITDITGSFTRSGSSVVNPQVVHTTQGVVVAYRDYLASDKIHVFRKQGSTWKEISTGTTVTGNYFRLCTRGSKVYLTAAYGNGNHVYQCDLASAGTFTKYANAYTTNTVTGVDLFFDNNGTLYVAYYDTVRNTVLVEGYQNGSWQQVGMNVYNQMVSSVNAYAANGKIYVAYQGSDNKGIKSHAILTASGNDSTNDGADSGEIIEPGRVYTDTEAFVVRLYDKCLGREPDEGGLAHWNRVLTSGERGGAKVGYGFVFSKEYLSKNTTNEEYVDMLYNVFLNREADASGRAHWVDLLNQGLSREYVFRGFAHSKEYTDICNSYGIVRGEVMLTQPRDMNPNLTKFVNRLYVQALGRSGEADGINHWCNVILTKTRTPEEVAERFINSEEFRNKKLSDEEYVKVLYRTFMGREYDQEGLEHWLGELERGCSRENILHRFANSKEFKGIMAQFGL